METIELYEAYIEREPISNWRTVIVGLFKNEEDAKNAIKLYKKVYESKDEKFLNVYNIEKKSFPNSLKHKYFRKYFSTLDEFIDSDECICDYIDYIGADELCELLKETDVETKAERNLRIIERMIRHYQYQIKINENLPVDVEDYKENVKFLQDLRDGKIELK